MKTFFRHFRFGAFAVAILCMALGSALLLWPDLSQKVFCYAFGGTLTLCGVFQIASYLVGGQKGLLQKMMFTGGVIRPKEEQAVSEEMVKELNIMCKNKTQPVKTLSGGNQQKVVLGKCLITAPKVLILDEPTRGIDVGAKREIYHIIDSIAAEGVAVIMISSDMPELIGMSDRIYVMKDGCVVAEIKDKADMQQEKILSYTIGQK